MVQITSSFFQPCRAVQATLSCSAPAPSQRQRRGPLVVEAQKKAMKKAQVMLFKDVPNLGQAGMLTKVPLGFYRNFLQPQGLAGPATKDILTRLAEEAAAEERKLLEAKAKAQAMATALQTIGKFIIKKKAGDKDTIFGSVTPAEIVEAIASQTGRTLDKRMVSFPIEPRTLGTFECNVRLHPEVTGSFKVLVQKEKMS